MALIYWYKDKKTKAPVYYDTDDLNDEEYYRINEIYKELKHLSPFSERAQELYEERNIIVSNALRRIQLR